MTTIDTNEVALRFTELLPLTKAQWLETMEKMKHPDYALSCPTHDYCDANVYMQDAFERLGIPVFERSGHMVEETRIAWNEAWEKARAYWLTKNWEDEPE